MGLLYSFSFWLCANSKETEVYCLLTFQINFINVLRYRQVICTAAAATVGSNVLHAVTASAAASLAWMMKRLAIGAQLWSKDAKSVSQLMTVSSTATDAYKGRGG